MEDLALMAGQWVFIGLVLTFLLVAAFFHTPGGERLLANRARVRCPACGSSAKKDELDPPTYGFPSDGAMFGRVGRVQGAGAAVCWRCDTIFDGRHILDTGMVLGSHPFDRRVDERVFSEIERRYEQRHRGNAT